MLWLIEGIGASLNPLAVVAHVTATFGMFLFQFLLRIHENDVRLDLGVVVVGGFAVAPRAVDLDILVERVP
jgi:hypothetical protein